MVHNQHPNLSQKVLSMLEVGQNQNHVFMDLTLFTDALKQRNRVGPLMSVKKNGNTTSCSTNMVYKTVLFQLGKVEKVNLNQQQADVEHHPANVSTAPVLVCVSGACENCIIRIFTL